MRSLSLVRERHQPLGRASDYALRIQITKVGSLHATAGRHNFDFLKIITDERIAGRSEYNERATG